MTTTLEIDSADALTAVRGDEIGALVLFTSPDCSVCRVIRPLLAELVSERFPRLQFATVDAGDHPELAAQEGIFSFPTVIAYLDGRETLRRSRSFGIGEIADALDRPYHLLTG